MKIISGTLKGRKIDGFDIAGTRPTMDRVKESLFSMINPYLDNAICLDLLMELVFVISTIKIPSVRLLLRRIRLHSRLIVA